MPNKPQHGQKQGRSESTFVQNGIRRLLISYERMAVIESQSTRDPDHGFDEFVNGKRLGAIILADLLSQFLLQIRNEVRARGCDMIFST